MNCTGVGAAIYRPVLDGRREMLIFLQELVLQLFLWLLQLIDGIMQIFSAISGVMTVTYHGNRSISSNCRRRLDGRRGVLVYLYSGGRACVYLRNRRSRQKHGCKQQDNIGVMGKFFLSLLGTMAMLVVVILGILIANSVLQLIAQIFQISNTTKLSTALFDACAGNGSTDFPKRSSTFPP
ncbi:MAG: hypothetical protein ACLRSW_06350 [Christensenellaceae bacterium]